MKKKTSQNKVIFIHIATLITVIVILILITGMYKYILHTGQKYDVTWLKHYYFNPFLEEEYQNWKEFEMKTEGVVFRYPSTWIVSKYDLKPKYADGGTGKEVYGRYFYVSPKKEPELGNPSDPIYYPGTVVVLCSPQNQTDYSKMVDKLGLHVTKYSASAVVALSTFNFTAPTSDTKDYTYLGGLRALTKSITKDVTCVFSSDLETYPQLNLKEYQSNFEKSYKIINSISPID